MQPLIFDGHVDLLSRLWAAGGAGTLGQGGAIDPDRARAGGWGGGFLALWVPSDGGDAAAALAAQMTSAYDIPLARPVGQEAALAIVEAQMGVLDDLVAAGAVEMATDAAGLRAALDGPAMAGLLHLEGAECIGPDLAALHDLHARGLRSLGPVWSRDNRFGHGVPFRFPATGDTGPGLTPDGVRLVRDCAALGVIVDLSHITEAGFRDVARHYDGPLVATHSNAHAICPHARNLTDDQLRMVRDSGGVVGLNLAVSFLRPDGRKVTATGVEVALRHLDHMLRLLGEDGVAIGTDYDGAVVPDALADVSTLGMLREAMRNAGYGDALTTKICHGNWLRLIERTGM